MNMTILQSAVIAYPYGAKMRERQIVEVKRFLQMRWRRIERATQDVFRIKRPRCQEETSFEFSLPSYITHFPKEHHRSSSSSYLSSATKNWWHTEVVHAPQACIFRAHGARGTHIFRSPYHFVANQVVCAWQINETCRTLG